MTDRISEPEHPVLPSSASRTSLRAVRERMQLSEEIAAYIRELIVSGQLRSRQSLSIDALAREFGTSATPVREALIALRGDGFVHTEPRRGFRVTPLTRRDVEDTFFVQAAIAGELASRAARVVFPALLTEVTRLQKRMQRADARSDDNEIEMLNFGFHRTINRTAASPETELAVGRGREMRYAPRIFYSKISGWHDASFRYYAAIIEGIRNNDPHGARSAMIAHIEHAGDLLVRHVENEGFWAAAEEAAGS